MAPLCESGTKVAPAAFSLSYRVCTGLGRFVEGGETTLGGVHESVHAAERLRRRRQVHLYCILYCISDMSLKSQVDNNEPACAAPASGLSFPRSAQWKKVHLEVSLSKRLAPYRALPPSAISRLWCSTAPTNQPNTGRTLTRRTSLTLFASSSPAASFSLVRRILRRPICTILLSTVDRSYEFERIGKLN